MAEGATKKRAMSDLCISCAGFGSLPDDILIGILSRVPIKTLCHCKLGCKRWHNLISHREHRKKLPQTLDGFFYNTVCGDLCEPDYFTVSGAVDPFIDPSLLFLTGYESIDIKDSCNGLLLCCCWKPADPVTMEYVVCNPATKKWVVFPGSGWSSKVSSTSSDVPSTPVKVTRLGFDPAVSSHFYVFEFIPDLIWYKDDPEMYLDGRIEAVAIYYSRTGVWSLNKNEDPQIWADEFAMHEYSRSVFFNGVLHLATYYHKVLAIDVEGKFLRCIPLPLSIDCDIPVDVYISQGHLYLASHVFDEGSDDESDEGSGCRLSVWVLEDYNSENWTLKHNVDLLHLFGADYYSKFGNDFNIISVHPEHDLIFMVCGKNQTLMSYEMDHSRLRFISQLGWNMSYPYVPLFLESLADDEQ